ncbi:MAG TPA: sulfatase-like hydrolase/transferase, partial [bacterium]|nr:sulfatase-like hydrolase/transferase [bacterium]
MHEIQRKAVKRGMLLYLALFLISLFDATYLSYMGIGFEQKKIAMFQSYLESRFIFCQVKILGLYLFLGWVLSLLLFRFFSMITPAANKKSIPEKVTQALLLTHLILLAYSMKLYPSLYSPYFWERGGWRGALQSFVTDRIPMLPLKLLFWTGLIFYLCIFLAHFLAFLWSLPALRYGSLALCSILFFLKLYGGGFRKGGTNVIILAADSLRQDRFGAGGYERALTPNLDALAARGVFCKNFNVSLPRTFQQWTTNLTSLYPAQHGIRHMFPDPELRDQERFSLLSHLKKNGYESLVVSDFAGDV